MMKVNFTILMQLSSPAFQNHQSMPAKYTCDGENVSPSLIISNVPTAAKSLAILVDDPDAPRGDFVHWLIWNIDPSTSEISQNSLPAGANTPKAIPGTSDFGTIGWGGPCPPSGTHRYQFKLYALDAILELPNSSRKPELQKAMEGHVIEQAILVGLYKKSH